MSKYGFWWGLGAGIAGMWGLAYYNQQKSSVLVPAGTPYLLNGSTTVLTAPTQSKDLPIGATFVLNGHQYSVQAAATVEVA